MATLTADRPLLHRVSWGALFAGFFVGFGVWLLLLALGAGIGLATFDPKDLSNWQGLGIGFGIWGVIAGIIALFVGGFIAARLSASEERTEGVLHGIALWGFMMVAGLWIASMAVGKAVSGAASVAGTAAQTAAQAASGASADPRARQNAQRQARDLQAQAQQKAGQAQAEIQQNAPEAAEKAATVGTTGAWAFFLYGALTLAAAALGGGAGVPRIRRVLPQGEPAPLPDRPLSPQRV
jgi:ABC-type transport system involved in multi-copper enzyme maturation permease subunit